jgi:cytochrome o ubiquinol oxidase subunit 2
LLEAIWWTIPIIIIAILATITWITAHKLDPYKPLDSKVKPVTIQVVALEWKWLFIYPEQHIATVNFVEFPVNTPVEFQITADAPMNSFQIPALGGQIYAMAGMTTKLHYLATEQGDYNGRSVSYSGAGFSGMTFVAHVTDQAGFNAWVKQVQKTPAKLTTFSYNQLVVPSENNAVQYFGSVTNGMFNSIIMKFMMPAAQMQNTQMQSEKNTDYSHDRDYESRWNKKLTN